MVWGLGAVQAKEVLFGPGDVAGVEVVDVDFSKSESLQDSEQ